MARALNAWLLAAFLLASARGQQAPTREEQVQQRRTELAGQPVERDQDPLERFLEYAYEKKLTTIFTYGWKGVVPVLGGLLNEQGFAAGAQFQRHDLRDGKVAVRASARGSIYSAYLMDTELGLPELAGGKAFLDLYLRQRNNPRISFFGIGPDSSESQRTNYLMEDSTAEATFAVKPLRPLALGITAGYLKTNVGRGNRDEFPSPEQVFTPAQVPGLQTQPDYFRGGGIALFDWRDNPYDARSGGFYYGRFDYYDARNRGPFNFRRLTAEAQQYVPLFNKKRVVALRARTILSYASAGEEVPFYLQPSLGSSDDLRGFDAFRFYDRNSFVLNGEWRWEVFTQLDAALFIDAGKVFPRPGLLNFAGLEKSYGGGLRFRAPGTDATAFRIDVAASREGVRVWFVFNPPFTAPAIRTGRELNPPTGRLP